MKQKQRVQPITVEMLINVLRQLEPKSRLGILLGGLVATADELGFPEAELVRVVRVACVQRAIAIQVQKDRSLVNAAGHPVMPTGPIDLARPIPWRCPLCDLEVAAGVKHKHTAQDWMTGKRVLSDPDDIGEGDNAIGPPAGELAEARNEARFLADLDAKHPETAEQRKKFTHLGRPVESACKCAEWPCPCGCHSGKRSAALPWTHGPSTVEEPPTLDEGAKRRERLDPGPQCVECGQPANVPPPHLESCSFSRGQGNV